MKSLYTQVRKYFLVLIAVSLFYTNSSGQFYEWAFNPGFVSHGATGSFRSTDMHGNGYFFSYEIPCMACDRHNIHSYSPSGQVNWSLTNLNLTIPAVSNLYAVDADSSKNRYVLIEFNPSYLPFQLGVFSINDPYCMVKFDSSGVAVRVTVLPEKYTQIKTDSVGNAFISTGTTVRRYNKFGNLSWEYLAGFAHQLYLDIYKNTYLVNNDVAVKLSPHGLLKYSKTELGSKTVDIWGRLYVSTSCGLERYTKGGIFQWIRPGISGVIQINRNGNIYAFRNDSIFKYNHIGTVLQWTFAAIPSPGIVNLQGDVYFGSTYDPLSDFQLCPFRLPSVGQFAPVNSSQLWVAKLNGMDPLPFQAAVYTNYINNQYGVPDNVFCTSTPISVGFTYCTNAASSFAPGNQFSVEVSDDQGNFANATNIGSPSTTTIPDSLPYGTGYHMRVVSTTPGVMYYPNLPYIYDNSVYITPNKADLSLSGIQNICQGATLQLSIEISDTINGHINWYNSGNLLSGSQNLPAITIDSTGNYYAIVTNYSYCMHQTDTVAVNVNPRPDPVINPAGPITFCQGDSAVLNVVDVDLSLIKWRLNGINIPGANDTTLSVYAAGTYAVRVFNQYGCARTSAPVDVFVPCRTGLTNNVQSDIIIYPNPSSGDSEWGFIGIDPDQYVVTITDLTGREVFHQTIYLDETTTLAIHSSDFAPGTYNAKIIGSKQKVSRLMVITE